MLSTITSFIRHSLGMLLASYVTSEVITADQVDQITAAVVSLVSIIGLVGWSFIEKKFLTKKS